MEHILGNKWYSFDEDILEISKKLPKLKILVELKGEDDTYWKTIVKKGYNYSSDDESSEKEDENEDDDAEEEIIVNLENLKSLESFESFESEKEDEVEEEEEEEEEEFDDIGNLLKEITKNLETAKLQVEKNKAILDKLKK